MDIKCLWLCIFINLLFSAKHVKMKHTKFSLLMHETNKFENLFVIVNLEWLPNFHHKAKQNDVNVVLPGTPTF